MMEDKSSKMVHCDVGISKALPTPFIDDFLSTHAPTEATQKHILLNQGGELCGSPKMSKIFKKHSHTVLPTALDASNQNLVKRNHQTVANSVWAVLIGANPQIKVWPHWLLHDIQIFNSLPSRGQTASPVEMASNKKEDWSPLRAFGHRVWVQPPGRRLTKFRSLARKGIFPGHTPMIAQNFLWHDCQTDKVKIATNKRFDEDLSNSPVK